MFVPYHTEEIRLAYQSKHKFKRENQVILLMIPDGKKCYYLAVKSLYTLLREIKSNHNEDFYCLNCVHSYSTNNKPKRHERVCNGHDYCHVEMPNEGNRVLKYKHCEKWMKAPLMIYADLEFLLEIMHSCQNNPEKSYTEKKLSIHLLTTCCLEIVWLIWQKANLIVTKVKALWKGFVKT